MAGLFHGLREAFDPSQPALFLDGEAAAAPEAVRRWSFLALRPSASMCLREGEAWWREGTGPWTRTHGSPWELLRRLQGEGDRERGGAGGREDAGGREGEDRTAPNPFPSGVAGFVAYDAGRLIERLPSNAEADTPLPWMIFHRFDEVAAQRFQPPARGSNDGAKQADPGDVSRLRATFGASGSAERPAPSPAAPPAQRPAPPPEQRPGPPAAQWPAPPIPGAVVRIGDIVARTSPKEFEEMVVRAKAHIRAGDVFQVNLSHRLACPVEGSPLDLYAQLRAVNPAPFSAFYHSGPLPWDAEGFSLLSSSPERLFSLTAGRLEARPIAGTRRRDADPTRDAALVAELRADPKEQAEHVMLVDLARNDLGRVAAFGTVRVPDLLTVETYRTVHHLVSVVDAQIAEGKDWVDALRAMFPGGTITGAPKVRSMEIIEELEPVRRGAYTGSLGWANARGDCDMNILIRTLVLHRGMLHLQVGAGIVEESDPRREYDETLAKAKGLLMALGKEAPA